MRPSSRFTLTTVFSLLLVCIVSLTLRGLGSVTTQAAGTPSKPSTKSGVTMASCGFWTIVSSPNHASPLTAVAAISTNNVWAVGYGGQIEHWNGISWNIVPNSTNVPSDNVLTGVTAISATNIWAVGYYFTASSDMPQTLIEHWNGVKWNVISSPNVGSFENYLTGVTAVSANNVWAVGYYDNISTHGYQSLIEHWNGTRWVVVSSPNLGSGYNQLNAVATVSASNIWAVGQAASAVLIEHWNGTRWAVVSSPNLGSNSGILNAVAVLSANNVRAVGSQSSSSGSVQTTLIEHWDGTTWSAIQSANVSEDNALYGVVAISVSNVWAVGNYYNSNWQTMTEHWNGVNWSIIPSPNGGTSYNILSGVARVPGTSTMWAVGEDDATSNSLIEFYC